MNESTLTRGLLKTLRAAFPDGVIIKHSDSYTSGVPDISVTWNGRTTWIEVKFANPRVLDKGVQALMMKRLANAGSAVYVIYTREKTTHIVKLLEHYQTRHEWENSNRIDHILVREFIRGHHHNNER
jgi:hypothetical protein